MGWIILAMFVTQCVGLSRLQRDSAIDQIGLQHDSESGASKVGGSHIHNSLPPCKFDGREIIQANTSCIFTPTSSDGPRDKDGAFNSGGGGDVKESPGYKSPPDVYDKNNKYPLMPTFMISASSVIGIYIIVHCLYLHCYAKRKMRQLSRRNISPHAIIFSDGDGPSTSSIQAFTPMVSYDGSSYGHTEVSGAQPFIVYQTPDTPETPSPEVSSERRPSKRKKSMHLQIPEMFRNRGRPRTSVCSAGATLETPMTSTGGTTSEADKPRTRRPTRASICYIPVSRTISDPTGGAQNQQKFELTPLQGFIYPSVVLPNTSFSVPRSSISSASRDELPTSPFILIPNPAAPMERISQVTNQRGESEAANTRGESEASRQPSSRKTSFKDPEAETVTIPLTSYPEEDKENI